jgi:hypothetical protein
MWAQDRERARATLGIVVVRTVWMLIILLYGWILGLCGHNLECRAAVVAFDTIRHTLPLTQCRHDCHHSVTPQRMYGVNHRDNVITSGGVGDLALAAATHDAL